MKDPGPRFGIHGLFLKITRVPTEPENFIEIRPSLFELSCTHTDRERDIYIYIRRFFGVLTLHNFLHSRTQHSAWGENDNTTSCIKKSMLSYLWSAGGSSPIAVRYSCSDTLLSPDESHALNIDCRKTTETRKIFIGSCCRRVLSILHSCHNLCQLNTVNDPIIIPYMWY